MAEELSINHNDGKAGIYKSLIKGLESLCSGEADLIANMANISAALKETFGWWWVGFYLVKENSLVLGPFQGPIACTRIGFGRGVCGTAWKEAKSLLVPDVDKFPGHIACSSQSVAEIVVPVFDRQGQVAAVLDIDSERFDVLDETDVQYLDQISALVSTLLPV